MGTQVDVSIPNNDFTGQKTIIGQHMREGDQVSSYVSPFQRYDPLQTGLVDDETYRVYPETVPEEWGLYANGVGTGNEPGEAGESKITIFQAKGLQNSQYDNNYQYLGISGEFKTLLSAYNVRKGEYGLRIGISYVQNLATTEEATIENRVYLLSTSDMIGNLYNFTAYFKQEKLIPLEENKRISAISVEFYQKGDFKDFENNSITYNTDNVIGAIPKNILLRNLQITFGNDPLKNKDRIKISTTNGTTYDSANTAAANEKNIKLQ